VKVTDLRSDSDVDVKDEDAIYSLEFKDKRLFICRIYIFNPISQTYLSAKALVDCGASVNAIARHFIPRLQPKVV
jgi:hypothetical protein